MANSAQVDAAIGITEELTNGSFSQTFTPRRQYGDIDFVLAKENTLVVDVIPYEIRQDFSSRKGYDYNVVTTVCVRYKFPRGVRVDEVIPATTIDPYMVLVQEISDFFSPTQPSGSGRVLTSYQDATWQELPKLPYTEEPAILAPYDKYLRENDQFVGLVRIMYMFTRLPGE